MASDLWKDLGSLPLDPGQLIGDPLTGAVPRVDQPHFDFGALPGLCADDEAATEPRTIRFSFPFQEGGDDNLRAAEITAPPLSLYPVPALQQDKTTILFDLEVESGETGKSPRPSPGP